jgi:hypothetical protein
MEKYHIEEHEETNTITMGKTVALVLFDCLSRWQGSGFGSTIQIEHDAEWHALSVVLANLETQLVEPFMPDYLERVQAARKSVVEQWGQVEP